MRVLQFLIIIFSIFVLLKARKRYKQNELSERVFVLWLLFWLSVIFITLWPRTTDFIAQTLGIASGRGVDLAVYVSVPILYYAIFRIIAKLDRIEKNQTKIIRHIAISETKQDNLPKRDE